MNCMDIFMGRLNWAVNTIRDYTFKVGARMSGKDFSRESKLSFADTCFLILRGSKRSLQAAIYSFLRESKSEIESYSKQAFSKRRQLIRPEAFLTLFCGITHNFFTDPITKPKAFHGLNVFAVDGTAYNLPNTPELAEVYGVQLSGGEPQVQAKGSCLYDILDNLLIDVKMLPIKTSEREIAKEHLDCLHSIKPENNLVLLDRGYPSLELIQYFEERHIFYLMRCNKAEFFTEIRTVDEPDKVLEFTKQLRKTKETLHIRLRVIQFELGNGVRETLITNVLDSGFSLEDFKYLYHLRWGIEEKYNELKNKLKIEAFSGQTPVAVLQDFYATMFLSNLVAFAEMDCEEELAEKNGSSEKKYQYSINRTMAIASVKDMFIELVIEDSNLKKKRISKRLKKRLLENILPLRPGRSSERRRKHPSLKFPSNRTDP